MIDDSDNNPGNPQLIILNRRNLVFYIGYMR